MIRPDHIDFPEKGMYIKSGELIFDVCCDCGLRHSTYIENIRGKEIEDDLIYIQTRRDERGTKLLRRARKYPVFRKNKK